MIDKKLERKLEKYCAEKHRRDITIDVREGKIDEDKRTVELSFSSETTEVERWFGIEVLGHDKGEIDLDRMNNGAPVLFGHDPDKHIGVIEKARVKDGKGRALIRFGNSDLASEKFRDIIDGILRNVSVGYFVRDMVLTEQSEDGPDVYRVSRWQPFELSMLPIPADTSVGVGRGIEPEVDNETPEQLLGDLTNVEIIDMTDEEKRAAEAARKAEIDSAAKDAREQAQADERSRVAELIKVGEQYGADDLARECINSGADVHELNKRILEKGGLDATRAENPDIGMTEDEVKNFSFLRFLNALAHPDDKSARDAAGFELECSAAAANQMQREARGVIVPYDVLVAKRAMTVGAAAAGGNLVATELDSASFIDLLFNRMALVECGITKLPGLNGNIAIPRQNGGASHFWLAENGAPTESNATFDQVALTPTTVGAFTELSRRLLKQSSIDSESFAINELVRVLALAIDSAGINGTGAANQPTGILATAGIGDVAGGINGLAPTWDHVVDLETGVAVANADLGSQCYLTNAKVRGKYKRTFIDAGSGERIWDSRGGQTPVNGYRAVISNQVPSDLVKGTSGAVCSAAIFGNFADLVLGMWGGLDIQVNPYSLDTTGAVRVTAFQDVDYAVRHPESFNAQQDILTV